MTFLKNIGRSLSLSRRGYVILGTVANGLILIGLIGLLLLYGTESPGRGERFLGRLHPVVVHLPIGILLAVFLYELTSLFYPRFRNLPALLFLIWIGFLTAAASVLAGYFLSLSGGYDASYLFWHKWLGVLVAVCSGTCFLFAGLEYLNVNNLNTARTYRHMHWSMLLCMAVSLSLTGHFGGTLTHGPGYVTEYLPPVVKESLGMDDASTVSGTRTIQNIQKAEIYGDLVKPVLEKRCVSCHGPSKKKGDLRLDSREAIEKGGESGKLIEPGNPEESELVRRITLPLYHEDVMPPAEKEPLSIGNTELIRWWIATGASFTKTVAEVKQDTLPAAVRTQLDRLSARPEPDRMVIYEADVPAADPRLVERISSSTPWRLSFLSQNMRYLEARYASGETDKLDSDDLKQLQPVRKQLAWLDVSERTLTDSAWAVLGDFPLLHRMHAERTNIQDRHLKHLSDHKYLKYLNVHHTSITDSGLEHLNLDTLSKLFVWQTDITEDNVKELRTNYPKLTIEDGFNDLDLDPGTKQQETGIVKSMSSDTDGTFELIASGIDNGTRPYTDRDYHFTNVPEELRGALYIRTPNHLRNKKTSEVPNPLLTVHLTSPATIYVAYDTRTTSKPTWLTDQYEETNMTMGLDQYPDFKFRIYRREVDAGKVTFGANAPDGSNRELTMFSLVLAERN